MILERIACWHGTMAADYYKIWLHTQTERDKKAYIRHAFIADTLWQGLKTGG
jgi:hypothetical protein